MTDADRLYFAWLMLKLEDAPHQWALARLCGLLHQHIFNRRIGNDVNRAEAGINLRRAFLQEFGELDFSPEVSNHLMAYECSWLEMLVALCMELDFLYDGGVGARFVELMDNVGLGALLWMPEVPDEEDFDIHADSLLVSMVVIRIDSNQIDRDGRGGLFPLLRNDHPDQREVEIWEQHAAYFRERLEGVFL